MASIPFQLSSCTRKNVNEYSNKQKIHQYLKVTNVTTKRFFPAKVVELLRQNHNVGRTSVAPADNFHSSDNQKIVPTKKQLLDTYRQGSFVDDGVAYRQTFVIRSYEVGPDRTATIETIQNLFQETALTHVRMMGLLNEFGSGTHAMTRNNLISVVSRMQVQVEQFPIWGEVIEIDTWLRPLQKYGLPRETLFRSRATGIVLARASSIWLMVDRQTRRLSKIPDEVRAELSPWLAKNKAISQEQSPDQKIHKLDNNARYIHKLKPKRSDLDLNHHVNNVKYVKWMLDTIPEEFLENHQLSSIIVEYRRECGTSDVVQSLCEPQEDGLMLNCEGLCNFTHLLQMKGGTGNQEAVRGKTTWKKKPTTLS